MGELVGYDGYKHIKGIKIHAFVSPESLPLNVQVEPGNGHDSKRFIKLLEDVRVKHGRARSRPKGVIGDSAYDAREIRAYLKSRGIKANIDVNQGVSLNVEGRTDLIGSHIKA